jgi:hypothetical protein
MSFRLQGKSYLITWSQISCLWGLTNDDIFAQVFQILSSFPRQRQPARALIALEAHKDGGDHIHAFVEYDRRLDHILTNQWDFDGKHPNVKPKRTKKERFVSHDYLLKDGTFKYFGDWIAFARDREQSSAEPISIDLAQTAKDAID